MRYCSLSWIAWLEYLSNRDLPSPHVRADFSWMTGCNCWWSPTRTTWRADDETTGMRLSASLHIAHSSMISCNTPAWHCLNSILNVQVKLTYDQGLKWGRVARVGDPAPFDLPGLYRFSCLLSCSSKSHKIPLRMHQNLPFSDKKNSAEGELDLGLRERPGFFFGPL